MIESTKESEKARDCPACKAQCCRSVTIEIDTPRSKKDIGEIMWFVLHKDVLVYFDYDNKWHVEFETPCKSLDKNNLCTTYNDRPIICRLYPKKDESCVYQDNPVKRIFRSVEEVTEYFDKKAKRKAARKAGKLKA